MIPKRIFTITPNAPLAHPEVINKCIASHRIAGYEHRFIGGNPEEHLYHEGGIYLSPDIEVVRDFEDMLDAKLFCGREINGFVGQAVIGAEAGHPILKEYLDYTRWGRQANPCRVWTDTIYRHAGEPGLMIQYPQTFYPYDYWGKRIMYIGNTHTYRHYDRPWPEEECFPEIHPDIDLRRKLPADWQDLRVLNIGLGPGSCGISALLPHLPFKSLTHVDVWKPYLRIGRKRLWAAGEVNFICSDAREFPVEDYDFCLVCDVLEHLPKQDSLDLLARMKRALIFCPLEPELLNHRPGADAIEPQEHRSLWTAEDFKDFETEILPGFHIYETERHDAIWAVK
jgi:hypothetical protein